MTAAEVAIVKDVIDREVPAIVAAESARLPVEYQPLVAAVAAALLPGLLAKLDALLVPSA